MAFAEKPGFISMYDLTSRPFLVFGHNQVPASEFLLLCMQNISRRTDYAQVFYTYRSVIFWGRMVDQCVLFVVPQDN